MKFRIDASGTCTCDLLEEYPILDKFGFHFGGVYTSVAYVKIDTLEQLLELERNTAPIIINNHSEYESGIFNDGSVGTIEIYDGYRE